MALAIVGVIVLAQPLLLIVGGAIFAVFLDGGVRLLGRFLPIPRGWRLLLVLLLGFGFLGWVFWFAGTTIAAQFEALRARRHRAVRPADGLRRLARPRAQGQPTEHRHPAARLGRPPDQRASAARSARVTSVIAMIVIGIFLAAEPRIYDRGIAWMLPLRAPRRLLPHRRACRLHAPPAAVRPPGRHDVRGRVHLAHADASAACRWPRCSASSPACSPSSPTSARSPAGVLMVAVGFSAGPHQGVYAIFVYFFVQNIDGYLVVPVHRPAHGRPRARRGARHAAADGRAVRDPRRAVRRPDPGDAEGGAGRSQQAAGGARKAKGRRSSPASAYCCGCCLLLLLPLLHAAAACCIIAAPPRHDLPHAHLEGQRAVLGEARRRRAVREGQPLRHGEAIFAAFLHPGHRLGEAGEHLVHGERLRRRRGFRCCRTPCRRRPSAHNRAAPRRRGRSARPCRP